METTVSPYVTTLDRGNAYWMSRLAHEVYKTVSDEDQMPCRDQILQSLQAEDSGFLNVYGADVNSSQGAVIEHEAYLCLAFRGTNELADWIDNINLFQAEALFGHFHKGFYAALHDIWTPLFDRIQTLRAQKRRPLFITGHSLGGAIAVLAAAELAHRDHPFTSVYTFGQPRAVTLETSTTFNALCGERVFRFQNNNDIVTRVPTRLMGYSHVGQYVYISEERSLRRDPGFWFRFLDRIDGALEAFGEKGIDGVEDHDMGAYIAAIKQWDFAG